MWIRIIGLKVRVALRKSVAEECAPAAKNIPTGMEECPHVFVYHDAPVTDVMVFKAFFRYFGCLFEQL